MAGCENRSAKLLDSAQHHCLTLLDEVVVSDSVVVLCCCTLPVLYCCRLHDCFFFELTV